jgi:catechol 2,3-dioxygenase
MSDARIDPGLSIGAVALTVADLERSAAFYRDALGFQVLARAEGTSRLGVGATDPESTGVVLLDLHEIAGARRPRHTTGLFHFAVLLPSRAELARVILRLSEAGVRIQGASDHGVSEAIYLADPDGNGIEIYRDRPREEWPREPGGAVRMPTDPLDLEGIMHEAPRGDAATAPAPADTRIGHVHLHVADLAAAERFYVDVLGFDVATRYGSEALFVSAGGYHHHVGLNVWAGVGAPPPPEGATGLRWFELAHSSDEERDRTAARVATAGLKAQPTGDDYSVRDPSGNGILLTVAKRTPTAAS